MTGGVYFATGPFPTGNIFDPPALRVGLLLSDIYSKPNAHAGQHKISLAEALKASADDTDCVDVTMESTTAKWA